MLFATLAWMVIETFAIFGVVKLRQVVFTYPSMFSKAIAILWPSTLWYSLTVASMWFNVAISTGWYRPVRWYEKYFMVMVTTVTIIFSGYVGWAVSWGAFHSGAVGSWVSFFITCWAMNMSVLALFRGRLSIVGLFLLYCRKRFSWWRLTCSSNCGGGGGRSSSISRSSISRSKAHETAGGIGSSEDGIMSGGEGTLRTFEDSWRRVRRGVRDDFCGNVLSVSERMKSRSMTRSHDEGNISPIHHVTRREEEVAAGRRISPKAHQPSEFAVYVYEVGSDY